MRRSAARLLCRVGWVGADRVVALALNNRATEFFTESLGSLNLALAALGRGADEEADALVTRGLEVAVALNDVEDIAWWLLDRAALLARRTANERAGVLVDAAESCAAPWTARSSRTSGRCTPRRCSVRSGA